VSENERIGNPARADSRDGWSVPRPERIPRPTYWPAIMALAIAFMLFGVVTSWIFTGTGAVMFVLSLGKWIGELIRDE
jgi:hypothetical protein